MMTDIITPEVRAALDRWQSRTPRQFDADLLADAMLSLCPPGMPAPIEFFGYYDNPNSDPRVLYRQPSEDGCRDVHGVFFPLKIVEPTE